MYRIKKCETLYETYQIFDSSNMAVYVLGEESAKTICERMNLLVDLQFEKRKNEKNHLHEQCPCRVKKTDVHGMVILFPKITCPVHKKYAQSKNDKNVI